MTVTVVGEAVLDWETASITLPLDAYGMDAREVQIVNAAASIVFARCATGGVDQAVIAEAKRALEPIIPNPDIMHWLFGTWDAPFVAEHGWAPFPKEQPPPLYVKTDYDTTIRCIEADEHRALAPINVSRAEPAVSDALMRLYGDAYLKTLLTPEYIELNRQQAVCIEQAGYEALELVDGDGGGVATKPDWSDEQRLKALLAQAVCDDQIGMTRQAADIDAAFQMEMIQANEAELLSIRQVAVERVAQAEAILREVGVL